MKTLDKADEFQKLLEGMNDKQLNLVADYLDYVLAKRKIEDGKAIYFTIGKHEDYLPTYIPYLTIADLNKTRDKLFSLIDYFIQLYGTRDLEYILITAVTALQANSTVLRKDQDHEAI